MSPRIPNVRASLATSLHLHHGEQQSQRKLRMMEFVPVGLLSLKAYSDELIDADIRVIEVNGAINRGEVPNDGDFFDHLVDLIARKDDCLVGLMTDADSLHHTVLLAKHVKARYPRTLVCLGGPAATPLAEPLLSTFSFIDLVVRGEGEVTFTAILDRVGKIQDGFDGILGLSWRRNGQTIHNDARPQIRDLDELPTPSYEAYDMGTGAPIYLDVGRGCPFICQFCATAPFWEREHRMKSIERIHSEMVLMREQYGRESVNFSHDIFTCNREWTSRFCDYLIANPPGLSWTCSTRTDIIDSELIRHMAAAGCDEIYFGIESGSDSLQKEIGKELDIDRSLEIVKATADAGIRPVTGFIVGYPMETRETLNDTLTRYFQFLEASRFRSHIFVLSPFAQSPMYERFGASWLDRPATYKDLMLVGDAAASVSRIKTEHPGIFSSTYRYTTPNVSSRLVDACEEVSTAFCTLRALWRHILPLYDSALEFFERWVEKRVVYEGPTASLRSLPELLLDFVEAELQDHANLQAVRELIRYERLKLDAHSLIATPEDVPRISIDEQTIVERSPNVVAAEFGPDLQEMISDTELATNLSDQTVVIVKSLEEELTTIALRFDTQRLWARAVHPIRVGALLSAIADDKIEAKKMINAVTELVGLGILRVAPARAERVEKLL